MKKRHKKGQPFGPIWRYGLLGVYALKTLHPQGQKDADSVVNILSLLNRDGSDDEIKVRTGVQKSFCHDHNSSSSM